MSDKKTGKKKNSSTSPEAEETHAEETHAAKVAHDSADGDHGHDAHGHDAHGHHAPDRKEYWRIWFILLVLTVLEVGVAYLEKFIGKTALVTCLVGMALAKAGIVALFYMHLKHETKVMRWSVMIPMMFPALYAFILIAEGTYRAIWGS